MKTPKIEPRGLGDTLGAMFTRGAASIALTLLVGCAPAGRLVAQSGEHRLVAADKDSGVSVVLTSEAWSGSPKDLADYWTVLHVLVANTGEESILLAPGDLELRDGRGFSYELYDPGAVFDPPTDTESTAYARDYRRDYDPGGPVDFEPVVPPGRVAEAALPWGELRPGTQMRGFVFFKKIESGTNTATLTWHVIRPDHERVVDLQFALYVARPKPTDDDDL